MGICTGIAIDSEEKCSRQIDILVYDRKIIPASMLTLGEGIVPIESVLATVEVKSKLTVEELHASIENARSIKTLSPFFAEMRKGSEPKLSTSCYVFAFSSSTKRPELKRLEQAVAKSNRSAKINVDVPISGLCIADKAFVYCKKASKAPEFKEYIPSKNYEAILKFLVSIVESSVFTSLQREPIFIRKYLLPNDQLDI